MRRGLTGLYEVGTVTGSGPFQAFVPAPLPPAPPLELTGTLRQSLDDTLVALGRLDSVSTLLPDTRLFLYTYVRKEAVLSSQIEGTQSSLSDLLLFELDEAPGVPMDDVREVSNYVAALEVGLQRIKEGLPISSRLIREMHGALLRAEQIECLLGQNHFEIQRGIANRELELDKAAAGNAGDAHIARGLVHGLEGNSVHWRANRSSLRCSSTKSMRSLPQKT